MKKIAKTNHKPQKKSQRELLMEAVEENTFYSKMALKMAEHAGCLILTMHTLQIAKEKGKLVELSQCLVDLESLMLTLDSAEVLIHEIKKLKR